MQNKNWFQDMFNGRVITANVIFTVVTFVFAFNVTVLPLLVLKYPKFIPPQQLEKIFDFSTNSLKEIMMFVLGRLTVKLADSKEEKL